MLKPIKAYDVSPCPTYSDVTEARDIAKAEGCIVELRWYPDILTGWYYDYIYEDTDPIKFLERYSAHASSLWSLDKNG